jgi:hypothetical protein
MGKDFGIGTAGRFEKIGQLAHSVKRSVVVD